jgi:hypothetical protein
MAKHHLEPSVETCHWGYFDATQKPVLKVKSGDIVTIDTVTGNPDVLPDDAVQPRRRPSRDPDRQWLQGRPYDDAQEARRRLRSRA